MRSNPRLALAFLSALGLGAGALFAGEVWIGLDQGSWRLYSGSSPEGPLRLKGPATGSDLAAPALSPDGSSVAVEVVGRGVAVCALATGECRPLIDVEGVAARPAWNPKTGELLFALYRIDAEGEDSDLWVAGPGLAAPRPLLTQTGNQDDPDISPDGRRLVYSSAQTILLRKAPMRAVRHLWIMDLVSGEPRLVSAGPFQDLHPDWSPDGKRIAFASDRSGRFEIWVLDVESGMPRQVTAGSGVKTWPAWSPDGGTILFSLLRDGLSALVEVDAGARRAETFVPFGPGSGGQMRDADRR